MMMKKHLSQIKQRDYRQMAPPRCMVVPFVLSLLSILFLATYRYNLYEDIPEPTYQATENYITPDNVMLKFVPRLYEQAGQRFDDLKTHKSCVWIPQEPSDPHNDQGHWHCHDCGPKGQQPCKTLNPIGLCPPFNMIHWDNGIGVRQRSHFRHEAVQNPTSWVMGTFGTDSWYESPVCSGDLTLPCFDIERCAREDAPMKVYIYNPERTPALLKGIQRVENIIPQDIQYTTNHSEACLFIVWLNSFAEKKDMILNPLYMAGQNHLLYQAGIIFGSHGDRTKPHSFNWEFAATLTGSLYDAQIRPGYDMIAPMPQEWRRPGWTEALDLHRPRRLLLSFKGRIERWQMPFQHHRWIASEFWRDEPDVVVDTACGGGGTYQLQGPEAYGELLLNSTFVFAPGGGGVHSFRSTEALAADAIPVVVSHNTMPFEPEVDWTGCVVSISEARIIDAPRILRKMSEDEIRARRERCRVLYRGVIGRHQVKDGTGIGDWVSQDQMGNTLLTVLRIWRQRTLNAHRKKDALKGIDDNIREVAVNEDKYRDPKCTTRYCP